MSGRERPESARWFVQAEADLESARVLVRGERFYMACFAAQQAAEKALKAFLYDHGAAAVFGHSVARLCRECSAHDGAYEGLRTRVKDLDHYYIAARYPNGLPDQTPSEFFELQDAESALAQAQAVVEFVKARLGS